MIDNDPTDMPDDDDILRDPHTLDERALSEPGDAEHGYEPLDDATMNDKIRAFVGARPERDEVRAHRVWTVATMRELRKPGDVTLRGSDYGPTEHGDDDPPAPAA